METGSCSFSINLGTQKRRLQRNVCSDCLLCSLPPPFMISRQAEGNTTPLSQGKSWKPNSFPQISHKTWKYYSTFIPTCLRFDLKEMSDLVLSERRLDDPHLRKGPTQGQERRSRAQRDQKESEQTGTAGFSLLGVLLLQLIPLSNPILHDCPLYIKSMEMESLHSFFMSLFSEQSSRTKLWSYKFMCLLF